jgi:RNA polymerase sigma factor (sigma-70 family)
MDEEERIAGLADFLERERPNLVRYARRRIADPVNYEAEDIVHDVALNLYKLADVGAPIDNLSAYIYTSIKNRIADFVRSRRRRSSEIQEIGEVDELIENRMSSHSGNPSQQIEKDELLKRLGDAMEDLSADERAVIVATEMENRTFRELSEEWDVPLGTLLARKSRGIARLRTALSQNDTPKRRNQDV